MARTKKQKKISFQLFLRKNAPGYSEGFYRVYLRVNFNTESTKLPDVLYDGRELYWREEDLEKWESGDYSGSYKGEADELRQSLEFYEDIIRYEYEKDPDKYYLKGLANKARFYRQNVFEKIESMLYYLTAMELFQEIGEQKFLQLAQGKEFSSTVIKKAEEISQPIQLLLELHTLLELFRNFQYNTLFDEYFGHTLYYFMIKGGKEQFAQFLRAHFQGKNEMLDYEYLQRFLNSDHANQRRLLPLLEAFPPSPDRVQLYLNLLDQHIKLFKVSIEI